ncbi:MAG: hypothetical protein JW808_07280 [Victivallales bacterium]|nr:hypothetical protein [Victivallales bacterium]
MIKKFRFDENAVFGNEDWRKRMAANGTALKNSKVRSVVFLHGTFAGNDSLGLFCFLDPLLQLFPQVGPVLDKMRNHSRKAVNSIVKDLGNFTPEYCDAFRNAAGMDCDMLVWSGGNYHIARLRAVVELASLLARKIKEKDISSSDRILLMGHSHAGQIFALLTIFLEDGPRAKELYKAVDKCHDLRREQLIEDLLVIDGIPLDFVCFGTPVRYQWGVYGCYRLLSIINHRSMVQLNGILDTAAGDYIQQWGTAGTDMMPPMNEMHINDSLDKVLDRGRNLSGLLNRLQRKRRQKAKRSDGKLAGHTILADYRDDEPDPRLFDQKSKSLHCIRTQFGHGVYTLRNAMLFNTDMIVDQLYSS